MREKERKKKRRIFIIIHCLTDASFCLALPCLALPCCAVLMMRRQDCVVSLVSNGHRDERSLSCVVSFTRSFVRWTTGPERSFILIIMRAIIIIILIITRWWDSSILSIYKREKERRATTFLIPGPNIHRFLTRVERWRPARRQYNSSPATSHSDLIKKEK